VDTVEPVIVREQGYIICKIEKDIPEHDATSDILVKGFP
jgi:hypothetical protein